MSITCFTLVSVLVWLVMIPRFFSGDSSFNRYIFFILCGLGIATGILYVIIIRYFLKSIVGFKRILNEMGTYLFIADAGTYQIKFINDAMKELYGLDDTVIGKRCWEAIQTGFTKPCPFCPIPQLTSRSSGSLVWEECNSKTGRYYKNTSSIIGWGNVKQAYLQHSVDIHDLKAAETTLKKRLEQQELLAAISQSFISAKELPVIINNALRLIGSFMRVSKVVLARLNTETGMLDYEYEWYNETQGLSKLSRRSYQFSQGGILYNTFILKGKPYLSCNDVEASPEFTAMYAPLGIKAFISIPIVIQGAFWGVLGIDECMQAHHWDESDIQFVQLIGNTLGGIIIRVIGENQLLRMSSIVDSTPQYVSYFNAAGRLEYINQGVCAISGYTSDELMRCGIDLLFDEDTRTFIHEIFIPTVLERGHHQTEIPLIRKDGEQRILSFSAFTIEAKKDDFGSIGTDITEIRALESALIAAKERAEQSSMAKSAFLSRMSHEMRTPLTAIIGMTAIIQSSNSKEKLEYGLAKINEASVHLLGGINDILDMFKIEAGKLELSPSEFDFEKMLLRVAGMMNFSIAEKQQSFTVNLDPDLPGYVVADEQRLAQVITNLLSNAVKFTPEKGTVTLSARRIAGKESLHIIQCSVADTGIGISPEQQSRLFSLFEQVDGSITRKFGGIGLGLAIAKNIIELMGGTIWVTSALGKGSDFTFEIALAEGSRKPMPAAPPEQQKPDAGQDDKNIFAGQRILFADDVQINREIVASLLEDTGILIDTAENGVQALAMFEEAPAKYRLILMDIHMPEMSGFEATQRIRALHTEEARRIPILAMTANVFKEDIDQCLAAGMNDHLGKPINIEELMKKLKRYLL
ncbi:MAG: response regulator [Spirochaetaceae bacterium]|nr:response regulator [Spirochaetaceae bacterium]